MKNLLATTLILCCTLFAANGQVSFGLRIGKSPAVTPGTNHLILNRQDPMHESLFNVQQVQYSEQIGLTARLDLQKFWISSDLMYGRSNATYSMIYTRDMHNGAKPTMMDEKNSFIELPVSLGVKLGLIDVFSGFNAAYDISHSTDLDHMNGFSASMPAMRLGWHSGVGLNLGHVLLDIRYIQEFGNYGQGRYVNGQELLLRNAPGRILVTAAYRI